MRTHERRGLGAVGWRVVLPLLALLAGSAPILRAQEPSIDTPYRWIEKGMRFGVSPGYILTSRGSLGLGPGSTPTAAGRFRIRVSNPLSVGINVTYGNSDRRIVNPFAIGGLVDRRGEDIHAARLERLPVLREVRKLLAAPAAPARGRARAPAVYRRTARSRTWSAVSLFGTCVWPSARGWVALSPRALGS